MPALLFLELSKWKVILMPSDYKAITKYNEEQLGKDTASRESQVNMYSDFSHFVFEILQNADDHEATKIKFKLSPEKLIIEHNGIPFKEKNVEAISYFGKSTSRDDLIKTGCFGLGFKSVFAITATPSIHSGDENFLIYGLYRLKALQPPENLKTGITRICLPFNHPEEKPDFVKVLTEKTTAFKEISHRLKELDMNTLLFTRNILEIKWSIQDEQGNKKNGHYLRDDENKFKLKISNNLQTRRTEITDGDNLDTYLVYSRPINWHNKKHKPVDIAFFLKKENEKEVISSSRKKLFVLFPTTIDTHMGFLINGPFRTPAHRETVSRKDDFNKFLFQEIALLITDTLIELRQKGLLTINLLETLPIEMQYFSAESRFYPIVDTVRNAFKNEKLLPANDEGVFVSSGNAKLARGSELRKLLTYNQLKELFQHDSDIQWLSGAITQNRASVLRSYLMDELSVEEIRPERFVQLITDKYLEMQSDDWIVQFYNFLDGGKSNLWEKSDSILRQKKFLRLESNSHVIPFKNDGTPNAYLPSSVETNFPTIKRYIFENEGAANFLKKLGIIEPGLFAETIEILNKYAEDGGKVDYNENIKDLKKIKKCLEKPNRDSSASSLSKLKILFGKLGLSKFVENIPESIKINPTELIPLVLNSIRILKSSNCERKQYRRPIEIYYDTLKLRLYFQNNSGAWFLSDDYPSEFKTLFQHLSINKEPKVTKKRPDNGLVIVSKSHGFHKRGLNGFDPDIKVDGLENAILNISIEKSEFIWNNIAIPHSACIRGVVESFTNKLAPENATKKNHISNFGHLLIENEWVPDIGGNFHRPGNLGLDDLPVSFVKDEKLAKQLRMKQNISEELLKKAGISQATFKLAQEFENQSTDIKDQIKTLLQNQSSGKPAFPTRKSPNPERRKEKIRTRHDEADSKTYEKKERSVKTSRPNHDPKSWLKIQYTKHDQELVCQMCANEMPFKLKDGSYYFEAVQVSDDFTKEGHELYLALCPLCAAKYRYLVKQDHTIMNNFFGNVKETRENFEIPIKLGVLGVNGSHSICFVEKHLLDLRTILEKEWNEK